MKVLERAVHQPISVMVAVILVIFSGVLTFNRVPVQMTPSVDSVVVSVYTFWENASPQEIEAEIVTEQEKVLSDLTALVSITSSSKTSLASVRLEFETGTDIYRMVTEVSQKLSEVPAYPRGVSEPVVEGVDPLSVDYMAWVGLASTDPHFDNTTLYDLMEKQLRPRLEGIEGIAKVGMFGARERELQIRFDPVKLANYGVSYSQLAFAIEASNTNYSGGKLPDGKRDIRIRAVGRYKDIEAVKNTVLRRDSNGPIYLRDVAEVVESYKEMTDWVRSRGIRMPFFSFQLANGANLLAAMGRLKAEIAKLNAPDGLLDQYAQKVGMNGRLEMVMPMDSSTYVDHAIDLVQSNILFGGVLSVLALLLFLRSARTIGVIAIAIPISMVGTIVVLVALGRSINIISLAGIAFAVGMVVDNAIVVIENIFRHLEKGNEIVKSCIEGTKEVAGAVFASMLTTIAVFLPILMIEDSAGQLFRDISLAIMSAVLISYIVSILVIPVAGARLIVPPSELTQDEASKLAKISDKIAYLPVIIGKLVHRLISSTKRAVLVIGVFASMTLFGTWVLLPPMDYLPQGNRDLAFGIMVPPPGYNLEQVLEIGKRIEKKLRPNWEVTGDRFVAETNLRGGPAPTEDRREELTLYNGDKIMSPKLDHYFLTATGGIVMHGMIPFDGRKTVDSVALLNDALMGVDTPDVVGFAFQFPLFNVGGTTGSTIGIDLVGDDLDLITQGAAKLMGKLSEKYGPYSTFPDPSNFLLPTPELVIKPLDVRLAELGMSRDDVGLAVQANGDGIILMNSYEMGGELKDIKIVSNAQQGEFPIDDLMQTPLATPDGNVVDLQSLAEVTRSQSADQIRHVGRLRAVTLQFTPSSEIPLEQAIQEVNTLIDAMRKAGELSNQVQVNLTGSAGKLSDIRNVLLGDGSLAGTLSSSFFLAILVVYLVMVILFQNWRYPLVIMVSVPLATFGGFIGLACVHWYSLVDRYTPVQNMDILTLLGFVILAGVVVNNAILIVYQALNILKSKQIAAKEAIREAVESRVRPIMMSTLTSVGGMLPLVFMPGAGSELYRGLGAVIMGGLVISTIFTLLLVPVILSLMLKDTST